VQPGSEQTNTSAHLCTRGEGVAKRWAVFVYIYINPPLKKYVGIGLSWGDLSKTKCIYLMDAKSC
jgi:hypothetical protein